MKSHLQEEEIFNMSTELYIGDSVVKTNSEGLFCLNDLHKASGGANKNKPNLWMELSSTKELASEILKAGNPAIKKSAGRYGGTYVSKEMVYSYAMWISAKFQLQVIRAYDDMQSSRSSAIALVEDVRKHSRGISENLAKAAKTDDELRAHGSNWGAYGASIRKARKEIKEELKKLIDESQMTLSLFENR